jgi:hypothetical protein
LAKALVCRLGPNSSDGDAFDTPAQQSPHALKVILNASACLEQQGFAGFLETPPKSVQDRPVKGLIAGHDHPDEPRLPSGQRVAGPVREVTQLRRRFEHAPP